MSIEIDAETLRNRRNANSTTPAEDRPACEHCGSLRIWRRGTGHNGDEYEHDYYCKDCQKPCDGTGTAKSLDGDSQ